MATDNKPKPEPWYPFNSGPPKEKAHVDAPHPSIGSASAALAGATPSFHKSTTLFDTPPQSLIDRVKPEAEVLRHAYEQPSSFGHKPAVSVGTVDKAQVAAKAPAAAESHAPKAHTETVAHQVAPAKMATAHDTAATQMDKLLHTPPPSLIDRLKPEPEVLRHAYEPAKPLVEKPPVHQVSLGTIDHSKDAQLASAAHAPVVARVHVHPPKPPRSAFGEVLHAEAKEMNRANGVIGSALAQGLHPDAIKAVVENRLHGHARDVANNVLAGASDIDQLSAKLADSQKVASALQAASTKALNADHAEAIVASRLKGDTAAAGVSAVQALAGPAHGSPSVTVSEPQLAASAPVAPPGTFDLPQIKVAGQPDVGPMVAGAAQNVTPEPNQGTVQPVLAASEANGIVTQPVPAPEHPQPLPMAEQPKVAVAEASGVVTQPIPAPDIQPLPMSTPVSAETLATTAAQAKPEVTIVERSSQAAADVASTATRPEVVVEDRSTWASSAGGAIAGAAAAVSETAGVKLADSHPGKAEVVVEDRSTFASVPAVATKHEVVVEDRSTRASLADAAAAGAADAAAHSTYSGMLSGKLHDAFSAATDKMAHLPEKMSQAVHEGLAKGEAKLHGAADSVAHVIQSAASAGAKVSLEDALASHMQDKGFDAQSIAAAGQIAQAIRQDMHTDGRATDAVLILHKEGTELASVVPAKDVKAEARPGDSVLAMDTLEKVAEKGLDSSVIKELRGAMPEAVQNRSDLELAQSVGPAKSELKGFDQAQAPDQAAQKQEKSAAAEQSRDAAAAMSMG